MRAFEKPISTSAIAFLLLAPSNPAKASEAYCGIMTDGIAKTYTSCSFTSANGKYSVRQKDRLYILDTNHYPPRLFIDGKFTNAGRGAYQSSSGKECDLFIALANQQEDFNTLYSNYPKGLCVQAISKDAHE